MSICAGMPPHPSPSTHTRTRAPSPTPPEEVNEAWAGLGYYRRARFLLEGARFVMDALGGALPHTAAGLLRIPGIGAYTAAAVASIAFGEREAAVDGNVIRVLARLRCISADPKGSAAQRLFARVAGEVLDPARPGDFNQAMMELGATICVPNAAPECGACPVAAWCGAYAAVKAHAAGGDGVPEAGSKAPAVTDYPAKSAKAAKREECMAVAVVHLQPANAFLLAKRPEGGLLAGLWELPMAQVRACGWRGGER
jgi:A/G-specific adenine glycosylase